jgi:hypothetical protein
VEEMKMENRTIDSTIEGRMDRKGQQRHGAAGGCSALAGWGWQNGFSMTREGDEAAADATKGLTTTRGTAMSTASLCS